MLWVKINNFYKNSPNWLWVLIFVVVFSFTRLPGLSTDVINPDGVNWHYRSAQFVNGLKYFQFEKTYQHYHPGVTLMWITGIPIELTKVIIGQDAYNNDNFLIFEGVAKYSVVFVQLLLSLFSIYLLSKSKVMSIKYSVLLMLLFSLEPFFVGNSRLYHLDVLLTLFVFNALLLSYFYIKDFNFINNKYLGILAGLFLALSFLTKSIGIGAVVFVLAYIVFIAVTKKQFNINKLAMIFISFSLFTFLLFPALWKDPVFYLTEIFSESERVGVRKGHSQIVFGEYTTDGGFSFYPLVLLLKVSPFLIAGFLLSSWSSIKSLYIYLKNKHTNFIKDSLDKINTLDWFLGIFYLGYFLVMLFPTKKIDRYMVVVYPALAYFAYFGLESFIKYLKNKALLPVMLGFVLFIVYPLVTVSPYYFTYYSPLFINASIANSVVAQKPFGVGVSELKDYVVAKYGNVKLGFIDTKPMETIYPSSKVFDSRVEGSSKYDLLILGPNEEIPENVLDDEISFKQDSTIIINGLDYWRIYVKENK
jgi:hypothetical protein